MSHKIFIGMTEMGKTFEAVRQMKASSKGVLFINYVDHEKRSGFEQVNNNTDLDLVKNLLARRRKVQFNVKGDFDKSVMALYKIFKNFNNIVICIDEIHLLNKDTKKLISNWWKVGRHDNIEAWGITQRPTELDRAMVTQSKELYIFKTVMEDGFFNLYKIDKSLLPKEKWKYHKITR